ncbi:hypothetical protein N7539_001031 [Penicillium diatomitis]|uniref:Uncharacterized protein n=1 Tax=Penicillium diatomitis TaxID=2819901 RepID=A0A9W9XNN3_9EURO|nr:uncharacterized protein N7539_001031 [Penicillium diatomitis]KAJ5495915.1 hypothetical protein N7539_001031 [Penicillium diatomitis]
MSEAEGRSHARSAVSGGSGVESTPANNVGAGDSTRDEGSGHVAAPNLASTKGSFLGLTDQKSRAENNFMTRADEAAGVKGPVAGNDGTCATEDHSFMAQKPGTSDTLPGWDAVKNVISR